VATTYNFNYFRTLDSNSGHHICSGIDASALQQSAVNLLTAQRLTKIKRRPLRSVDVTALVTMDLDVYLSNFAK